MSTSISADESVSGALYVAGRAKEIKISSTIKNKQQKLFTRPDVEALAPSGSWWGER